MSTEPRSIESLRLLLSQRTSKKVIGELRPSAVAMLLYDAGDGLAVLLTKRAAHLRSYPGSYTLPGGGVDAADNSLEDTALRETFEEVGIVSNAIRVLGRLDEQRTMSGYRLTPIVCWLPIMPQYQLNHDEVESLLWLPLTDIESHSAVSLIPFKTYKALWQLAALLGLVPESP